MADFVHHSETRNAVRELADPIADVVAFNEIGSQRCGIATISEDGATRMRTDPAREHECLHSVFVKVF